MPVLRTAVVTVGVVAALGGCASGATSTVGRVSDLRGRLCLATTMDNGTCFGTSSTLLSGLATGDCVRVDFTGGGAGREPTVTAVRRVSSGCRPFRPRPLPS